MQQLLGFKVIKQAIFIGVLALHIPYISVAKALSYKPIMELNVFLFQKQEMDIRGVVTDENNQVLPGVSVVEKGTGNGVITDFDGNFTIRVRDEQAILMFSYVGYETQKFQVSTEMSVQMKIGSEKLSEVVVTALGIERDRKELGYSFQEVSGESITNNPPVSVVQSLYGKVSGVNISKVAGGAGASSRIIIRGNNSINGNNQPLYVVDGIPIGNNNLASITGSKSEQYSGGVDNGDGLSSLNINDIENISVLKGGAASALYGERGANGVIVITTKKGKENTFRVEYNGTTTFNTINTHYGDYQRNYGSGSGGMLPNIGELVNAQNAMTSAWGPKFDSKNNEVVRVFDGSFKPYKRVNNNIQDFFRTGVTSQNGVSLSGGGVNTTYRFSYAHLGSDDVIPTSGLSRDSYMLRVTTSVRKLSVDGKLMYTAENATNRPSLGDDPNNIGYSLAGLAPNIDQKWLRHYQDSNGKYFNWNSNNYRLNPYYVIAENNNNSKKNRIIGSFALKYDLTDWLSANFNGGLDRFTFKTSDFINSGTTLPGKENGGLSVNDIAFQEYNLRGLLSAQKQFEKYGLSLGVGAANRVNTRVAGGYTANNMIQSGINNLSNFKDKILGSRTNEKILVNSLFYYFRANYNNYVFLDVSGRNDWNSSLATAVSYPINNNYSFFYPSFSVSSIFSDLLNIPSHILSFGKIRASWARTGKAPEAPFATTPFFKIKPQPLLGNPLATLGNDVVPNASLKPEISNAYEVGLDLSFFKNRLRFDFSYYNTQTSDQLVKLNISGASGYESAWTNIGLVENQGIESLISGAVFRAKTPRGFAWDMALNFSKNNNRVISLTKDTKTQVISRARWAGAQIVAQVGSTTSNIYGRKFLRTPDGRIIIGDNGLPKLTEGLKSLGRAVPKWIAGITNEFSYKNFMLKINFDMKYGGYVYSMTNAYAAASGLLNKTVEGRDAYNGWVKQKLDEGKTAGDLASLSPEAGLVVPGVVEVKDENGEVVSYKKNEKPVNPQTYWTSLYGGKTTPEPFVYDASYIKLRELSLGYNVPTSMLKKLKIGIDKLRLSFVSRNLCIIYSNIPNIDPESTYTNGNGQGFEYGSLPYRRSYGFNVQLSF